MSYIKITLFTNSLFIKLRLLIKDLISIVKNYLHIFKVTKYIILKLI